MLENDLNDALQRHLNVVAQDRIHSQVSIQSLQQRVLARVVAWANITWDELSQLLTRNVQIHPEFVPQLCQWAKEEDDVLLVQNFVRIEKLGRIVTTFARKGYPQLNALLAIDGLAITSTAPSFEPKRYVEHLKFPSEDDAVRDALDLRLSSPEDRDKRIHVQTVRKLYTGIPPTHENPARVVYRVMQDVYRDTLPPLKETLDQQTIDAEMALVPQLKRVYVGLVGEERLSRLVEGYKGRKREMEKDASGNTSSKKRKVCVAKD